MLSIKEAQGCRDISEEYTFEYILGEGSYGRVYKAYRNNEKPMKYYAVKQIDKD